MTRQSVPYASGVGLLNCHLLFSGLPPLPVEGEELYAQANTLDYEFPSILARTAYVSPFAQLGWGCILLNNAVVQNGVQVGNGSILNVGAEAHHDCTIDDFRISCRICWRIPGSRKI